MRLGIFGGTFDPPHIAHLILAEEAKHQLLLDRVLWVLTPHSPHKQCNVISPVNHRLDMVQAAIEGNSAFELSRVEIDRPAPHFAVDTVTLLGKMYPDSTLFYLMGGDSLQDLPSWHRPLEFIQRCYALGVMRRPGFCIDIRLLDSQLPGIIKKVQYFDAPLLEISASQIRHRVARREPFRYYLIPSVNQIILKRGLYQEL